MRTLHSLDRFARSGVDDIKTLQGGVEELRLRISDHRLLFVLTDQRVASAAPGWRRDTEIRVAAACRGKSGGVRLISYSAAQDRFVLSCAYLKSETSDLTPKQIVQLAKLVKQEFDGRQSRCSTKLLNSVREGAAILRSANKPKAPMAASDIRVIREETKLSQEEFARLIRSSLKMPKTGSSTRVIPPDLRPRS